MRYEITKPDWVKDPLPDEFETKAKIAKDSNQKKRKMWFKAGSILWLARHQASIGFRSFQRPGTSAGVTYFFLFLLAIFLGATFGFGAYEVLSNQNEQVFKIFRTMFGYVGIFIFVTGILSSMFIGLNTFIDRGDLDLLLSSPISPEKIVSARLLAQAWRDIVNYIVFGILVLWLCILKLGLEYLVFIFAAIGLALIISGLTFVIVQYILAMLGAAKGKKLVQRLGFLMTLMWIGFAAFQKDFFSTSNFEGDFLNSSLSKFAFFIGGAFTGDLVPAFSIFILGLGVFILAQNIAQKEFLKTVASLSGIKSSPIDKTTKSNEIKNFKSGFLLNMIFKEFRTLLRDSNTYIQAFAPLAGFIPLVSNSLFDENGKVFLSIELLISATTFIAGQITVVCAWQIVSIEEAPDLLASSPKAGRPILLGKILASVAVGIFIIFLANFYVALSNPFGAIGAFLAASFGVFSCAALEFSRPRPTKRQKLGQRRERSLLNVFLSFGLSILSAFMAVAAWKFDISFFLPFGFLLFVLAIAISTAPKTKELKIILFAKS